MLNTTPRAGPATLAAASRGYAAHGSTSIYGRRGEDIRLKARPVGSSGASAAKPKANLVILSHGSHCGVAQRTLGGTRASPHGRGIARDRGAEI